MSPPSGSAAGAGRVAVTSDSRVWLLGPDGTLYVRGGAGADNPLGLRWESVSLPGKPLRDIAAGDAALWALGVDDNVHFRRGISARQPAGKGWVTVQRPPGPGPLVQITTTAAPARTWVLAADSYRYNGVDYVIDSVFALDPTGVVLAEFRLVDLLTPDGSGGPGGRRRGDGPAARFQQEIVVVSSAMG
jgi:hypothetical protein